MGRFEWKQEEASGNEKTSGNGKTQVEMGRLETKREDASQNGKTQVEMGRRKFCMNSMYAAGFPPHT